MRKKEYERKLLEAGYTILALQEGRDEAGYTILALQKQRDDLQRHLQRIRIAHEPLYEAIYPSVDRPSRVRK